MPFKNISSKCDIVGGIEKLKGAINMRASAINYERDKGDAPSGKRRLLLKRVSASRWHPERM